MESCASFSKDKETEMPEIGTQSMLCRVYIVVDTYIKYFKKMAKNEKNLHMFILEGGMEFVGKKSK